MCIRDRSRSTCSRIRKVRNVPPADRSQHRSGPEAVSYTHLDVYKRQDLTMQKFAFNEMATAVAIPMGAIMICVPLCGFLGIIGTIQSFLEYPHKVTIGGDEK